MSAILARDTIELLSSSLEALITIVSCLLALSSLFPVAFPSLFGVYSLHSVQNADTVVSSCLLRCSWLVSPDCRINSNSADSTSIS